jgi:hypothetical protein
MAWYMFQCSGSCEYVLVIFYFFFELHNTSETHATHAHSSI